MKTKETFLAERYNHPLSKLEKQWIYEAMEDYTTYRVNQEKIESQFQSKWIPVSEPPPKNTPVLVYQPNENKLFEQFVCAYDGSNWRELEEDPEKGTMYEQLTWFDEITHWQFLPELPKP